MGLGDHWASRYYADDDAVGSLDPVHDDGRCAVGVGRRQEWWCGHPNKRDQSQRRGKYSRTPAPMLKQGGPARSERCSLITRYDQSAARYHRAIRSSMMNFIRQNWGAECIRYCHVPESYQLDANGTPEYTLRHKRSNDEQTEVPSSLFNTPMAARHSVKT